MEAKARTIRVWVLPPMCWACGIAPISSRTSKSCGKRCSAALNAAKNRHHAPVKGCDRCRWPGRPKLLHRHPCEICGEVMEGRKPKWTCDNGKCRVAVRRKHNGLRPAPPKTPPEFHNEHCRVCTTITRWSDQHWHQCLYCEIGFVAGSRGREFCSPECRLKIGKDQSTNYAAWRSSKDCRKCRYPWLREEHQHKCAECRKEFSPPNGGTYCEQICAQRAYMRKANAQDDTWMGQVRPMH